MNIKNNNQKKELKYTSQVKEELDNRYAAYKNGKAKC